MRILLVIALCLGCGGSRPPLAAKDFPAVYAKAVAQVQARCRTLSSAGEQDGEASALAVFEPDLDKVLAKGVVHFDPVQAQACIDGLTARGCGKQERSIDQACANAVTGTLPAGSACNWAYECQQGLCVPDSPGACPATCKAALQLGDACPGKQNQQCDERQGLRCAQGQCEKPLAANFACTSDTDCDAGLFCAAAADGDRCRPQLQAGAPCGEQLSPSGGASGQCAPGLFCDEDANGNGNCHPFVATGGTCGAYTGHRAQPFECAPGDVCKGYKADKLSASSGTCTPAGDVGAPCTAAADVNGCAADLVCTNGACAAKPATGPCATSDDCAQTAFCQNGQCAARAANGTSCSDGEQCLSGYCDGEQCTVPPGACHEP